jgi:TPP-dependent 2-oxoacid decarboxylase
MDTDNEAPDPETADTLMDLAEKARARRIEADKAVAEARMVLERAERVQQESAQRESVLRSWLRNDYETDLDEQETVGLGATGSETDEWSEKARTSAVEDAVQVLSSDIGFATPAAVESFLRDQGRNDDRIAIGAALAYLHRVGRIHNLMRGQWIPAGEVMES